MLKGCGSTARAKRNLRLAIDVFLGSEAWDSELKRKEKMADRTRLANLDHFTSFFLLSQKTRQRISTLRIPKITKTCGECIRGHMSCDRVRPSCQNCLRRKKMCRYPQDVNLFHHTLFPRPFSSSLAGSSGGPTSPNFGSPPDSVSAAHHHYDIIIRHQQELMKSLEQTIRHLSSQIANAQSRSYQWDPDEEFLHQLICYSKAIFEASDSRETAISQLISMLIRFAESHPSRMILICRVEPNSRVILAYVSETIQKWMGLSQAFLQECFDHRLVPFSSESRTIYLNSLVETVFNDCSGGNHTFIYERSSECIDSSQQNRLISCLTPLFYDRSDRVCCLLMVFSEHMSSQPIVKPVALSYHCPACSRPPSTILFQSLQPMVQINAVPHIPSMGDDEIRAVSSSPMAPPPFPARPNNTTTDQPTLGVDELFH